MSEQKPFKLNVFDTESLEDITNNVQHFDFKETLAQTYAWLTINEERIGLCLKRENPKNHVYYITMYDGKGNEVKKLMEVADEIQNGIPVHLSDYACEPKS